MEITSSTASRVPRELHPPFKKVLAAIASPVRQAILGELSAGEPLMVKELAERLHCSSSLVSKHISVLRAAGLVALGRAGMYFIPPHFLLSTAERHVDYGHCLLRLPGPGAP